MVKYEITFENFKDCLFGNLTGEEQMSKMNVIRSYKYELCTKEVNKIALSANDDKQIVLKDGVHTLAYGHYSLNFDLNN